MSVMWLDITNYDGLYKVNNKGDIYSIRRKKILKPRVNRGGYYYVDLCKNSKKKSVLIHRLVATAFIKDSDKKCVNHINGVKKDNLVENLEWCTHSENTKHAYSIGLMRADGSNNGRWKGKL